MNEKIRKYISRLELPFKKEQELIALMQEASSSTHDATIVIPNRMNGAQKKPLLEIRYETRFLRGNLR